MNYKSIKKMVLAGEAPTPSQFEAAIQAQAGEVARWAVSLTKHAAKVTASFEHPFPLPEDQKGRVVRRAVQFQLEMDRLHRLHHWREVATFAPQTAEPGVGSA